MTSRKYERDAFECLFNGRAPCREFAPSGETDIAYLCGNPNMVDACFEALKEAGLEVKQIRREKYVSSK